MELRYKAIQVGLCIACGGFQTGLLSYFTHKDLFPALVKVGTPFEAGASYSPTDTTISQQFMNDPETLLVTFDPCVLLGILANCKGL